MLQLEVVSKLAAWAVCCSGAVVGVKVEAWHVAVGCRKRLA